LQPKVPRDLETICLQCLCKEPAKRYASALALAEDLHRFLADEPIAARLPSLLDRGVKFTRRNKAVVAAGAGIVAALRLGTAGAVLFALSEPRQRGLADKARHEAERGAYQARLTAALAALSEHNVVEAARQLAAAPGPLRGWEWQHLQG